jgi:hypothetical protein
MYKKNDQRGQAMVEMSVLLPTLVLFTLPLILLIFIEWRGIKNREAVNMAARIYGQQCYGNNSSYIFNLVFAESSDPHNDTCNGIDSPPAWSQIPAGASPSIQGYINSAQINNMANQVRGYRADNNTIYGKMMGAVHAFIGSANVIITPPVPAPDLAPYTIWSGGRVDNQPSPGQATVKVQIIQFFNLPTILKGLPAGFVFNDTAYSGDDTAIYGFLRQAASSCSDMPPWVQAIQTRTPYINKTNGWPT